MKDYPIFTIIFSQAFGFLNLIGGHRDWMFFWLSVSWFFVGVSFIIKSIKNKSSPRNQGRR